ncbi:ribonuclease H-like domain-containing protein [Auriculariales sp. MPI-PUGE-AT-0066]|nr:ribonuclease H-like domain-containing protein [Auriculariales sp. MPI-PUGE-AT-0066]
MIVCDTEAQLNDIIPQMLASAVLFVDLEGRDLGCLGGALSVVSVGTDAGEVVLFDVLRLERVTLEPLLSILADETRPKFMWDGRKDSVELKRTFYDVEFRGVVDLQLVDVLSRRGHSIHALRQMPIKDVHGLVSLKNAGSEHRLQRHVLERRYPVCASHAAWMARPLDIDNIKYAIEDIKMLSRIYEHFMASGCLKDMVALLQMSARYLALHDGPVDRDDIYRSSDLLPHEIIEPPPTGLILHGCCKCSRNLSSRCFVVERRNGLVRRLQVCKVCNLLHAREELPVRKEELKVRRPCQSF